MAGDYFDWAPYVPLMCAMWRDPVTRARGAAAFDARYQDRGTELASAIDLLERAARYDEEAITEVMAVRDAAAAGNRAQQLFLTLLRYANEARKTQDRIAAPPPAVETDPYHRVQVGHVTDAPPVDHTGEMYETRGGEKYTILLAKRGFTVGENVYQARGEGVAGTITDLTHNQIVTMATADTLNPPHWVYRGMRKGKLPKLLVKDKYGGYSE